MAQAMIGNRRPEINNYSDYSFQNSSASEDQEDASDVNKDGENNEDKDDEEVNTEEDVINLTVEDLKPGYKFPSKECAQKSLKNFFNIHFHPFVKALNSETRVRYVCTHGYNRKYTASESRPVQRVNYTGCPGGININKQVSGDWVVGSKSDFSHIGHSIGPDIYRTYSFTKRLEDEDKDLLISLAQARAPNRKIAEILTQKTGSLYLPKDIVNLIQKFKNDISTKVNLEEDLAEIISEGGCVRWDKDPESGYINVLFIQTNQMKSTLADSKPTVLQCDTTFNTCEEGYKLFIPA